MCGNQINQAQTLIICNNNNVVNVFLNKDIVLFSNVKILFKDLLVMITIAQIKTMENAITYKTKHIQTWL